MIEPQRRAVPAKGFTPPDMTKVSREDIAAKVADVTTLTKAQAEAAVKAVFAEIKAQVAGGHEVSVYGFGTFEAVATAGRQAHNPKTMEPVTVPAGRRIKFKVSSTFRKEVKAS